MTDEMTLLLDLDQLEEALLDLDESMHLDQVSDDDTGVEGLALMAEHHSERTVVCWADGDIYIEGPGDTFLGEMTADFALLDDETGEHDYPAIARRMWQLLTEDV